MSHTEQHVWICDLCGEELTIEKDDSVSCQAGVGANYLPKDWGTVTVSPDDKNSSIHAHACSSCLEDVHTCVKELKRG
jgi:hypothetical protein